MTNFNGSPNHCFFLSLQDLLFINISWFLMYNILKLKILLYLHLFSNGWVFSTFWHKKFLWSFYFLICFVGFRNLHIDDQITLIQYSWMSLMVFGLGWRSYKHVSGKMLYFAPDLILNEQQMKELSFYSLCRSHRRLTKLAQKSFLYKSIATS